MRILQIGKFFPPENGGIEQVTFNIAEGLADSGIKNDVLCFTRENSSKTENQGRYAIYRHTTQIELLSTPISTTFWGHLRKIASSYDLIHLHCPNPWPTLQFLTGDINTPLVVHWHSDVVRYSLLADAYRLLENQLLKKARKIIATSQKYAEASLPLKKHLGKTEIIPIGIDATALQPEKKTVQSIRNQYTGKKIVFSLGRLIYYKGFDVLIKAAALLPDNYIILIGGAGPLREKLQETIDRLKINEKVTLLGSIQNGQLASYYAACDLFCLPSIERSEAFGVVLLEAMSQGKPIVATSIPGSGVDWVNQDGITGINVTPGDTLALSEGIRIIIENPEISQHFSLNGKKRYDDFFSRAQMVKNMITLYQKCCA